MGVDCRFGVSYGFLWYGVEKKGLVVVGTFITIGWYRMIIAAEKWLRIEILTDRMVAELGYGKREIAKVVSISILFG